MKWKVVIVGPTGTVYKNTDTFRLLYPFPTREEAQAHANCLRAVGVKIALSDERGNLSQPVSQRVGQPFTDRTVPAR